MEKMNNEAEGLLIAAIVIIVVLAIFGALIIKSIYIDTYTITGKVSKKYLSPADGGTTFVVKLEDGKKLEIKRNLWYGGGEYNEDDLYSEISENKSYVFTCWGWQWDFWIIYWYPNIIKAEELT